MDEKEVLWRKTIVMKNGEVVQGISEEEKFGIANCVFHIAGKDGWEKEAEGTIYAEIMNNVVTGEPFAFAIPCVDIERLESEKIIMLPDGG